MKELGGFSAKYKTTQLVYHEATNDVRPAIERGKQIKSWRRAKNMALVAPMNPQWEDAGVAT
jgi:predicted GIY-YIG superfamily endonuclease